MDKANNSVVDLSGQWHLLSMARPVTRWRRFRAWLGFAERSSLVAPLVQVRLQAYPSAEAQVLAEQQEPYCWICDDIPNCTMCKPEAPGQLDLFEVDNEDADN